MSAMPVTRFVLAGTVLLLPTSRSVPRVQKIAPGHVELGCAAVGALDIPAEQHTVGLEAELESQATTVAPDAGQHFFWDALGHGNGVVAGDRAFIQTLAGPFQLALKTGVGASKTVSTLSSPECRSCNA
jgi:hypothetical protein